MLRKHIEDPLNPEGVELKAAIFSLLMLKAIGANQKPIEESVEAAVAQWQPGPGENEESNPSLVQSSTSDSSDATDATWEP